MRGLPVALIGALLAACAEHPGGRCTSVSDCLPGQACREGLCRAPEVVPDVTAPVLVGGSPAPDATGVSASAVVTLTFDEPLARATVTGTTVRLETAPGVAVVATVALSAAGNVVTLVPDALAYGTRYTVVVQGVQDRAGNALAGGLQSWSFWTEPAPDRTAPWVSSRAPAPFATDVPVGASVVAVFSEPLDPATVTPSSVLLEDSVGTPVFATVSLAGGTVTLDPGGSLAHDAAYTVHLTTVIADLAGNPLATEDTWSFFTTPPPDVTPPAILSVSPAQDATGVSTGAQVRVVFSEAVSPGTIDATSLRVFDPQGAAVAGTRSVSGATATFTPAALARGTTYTVSVTTAVTDLAGNALLAGSSWSFMTACAASLLACGGACVDPAADSANCGGCGHACGAAQACRAGACAAAACPGGRISLAGRPPVPLTGDGPEAIAAGDLDGDGKVDLVVAETQQSSVGVFLGQGDGSFGPRQGYLVGSTPRGLVLADLDRDGRLDLVVAINGSTAIVVLRGNGDGTLAAGVSYATGSAPRGIVAADLNGDGNLDLAVAAGGSNVVSVLLGNGDGTFRPKVDLAAGTTPWGIAAADLNGDAKLDLAVSNSGAGSVSVLLGNGDGTFAPKLDLPGLTEPRGIVVADLDLDGKLDLAVSEARMRSVNWFRGNGDGSFRAAAGAWSGCESEALAVGFVDGDRTPDLVTGGAGLSGLGEACVVKSNGNGTFAQTYRSWSGGAVADVVAADLDGDGALDLATANRTSDTVTVLRGRGDGTFEPWVPLLTGSSPDQVVPADLDRNGALDLVASDALGGSTIGIYPGTAPGEFGTRFDVESAASTDPTRVAVGDLNGDGNPDLVYVDYYPGALVALLGDGAGGFGARVEYPTTPNPMDLALGDLDGDGNLDAVVSAFSLGAHDVFLGRGDGTFAPRVQYPGSGNGVALADFDRDGVLDVATTSARGGVIRVERGKGDGTLWPAVTYPAGVNSNRILAADLDGDGDVDLAETNSDARSVRVLLNRGDGTFAAGADYDVGVFPEMVAAADLDADGIVDLAVAASAHSAVAVLRGRGDGTFLPAQWFEAGGGSPRALGVLDLDGDGRPDLLVGGSRGVGLLRTACWPAPP